MVLVDTSMELKLIPMFCCSRHLWVSDCCVTPPQLCFSYIMGENKLIFNEMMMRSVLYKTITLCWIFIVPAHWNNSPRIDMPPHSPTHYPNQYLLFFLNAVCLVEKQQIRVLSSFVLLDHMWNSFFCAIHVHYNFVGNVLVSSGHKHI